MPKFRIRALFVEKNVNTLNFLAFSDFLYQPIGEGLPSFNEKTSESKLSPP